MDMDKEEVKIEFERREKERRKVCLFSWVSKKRLIKLVDCKLNWINNSKEN